ncbi:hypothetical protein QRX60_28630 [Amycolatopsis mongoliensis]|uniref:Uncharacterized protein n=1 Tax=Amycolatopsis mongoliensis TaxID=715475 RepID=A0A9Y2K2G2_9PSEU|nr:hypothetical protein [Amycolatopsis sp. 4-36]WIY07662.1 hypothetical protein QRX60_28630 [Amycolatopsis sp. 4-36]
MITRITEVAARMPETTRRMGCDCTVARVSFARRSPAGTADEEVGPPLVVPAGYQAALLRTARATSGEAVRCGSGFRLSEKAVPAAIPRRRPVDGSCREISVRLRKDSGDVHLYPEEIFTWSQVTLCYLA